MGVLAAHQADSSLILETAHHRLEKHCGVGDQIIVEHNGQRFFTKFRGAKGEFILRETSGAGKAKLTVIQDASYCLADYTKKLAAAAIGHNTRLMVRFISEGTVFSFNTVVNAIYARPPLLMLDYPGRIERRNLRESERLSTLLPVSFSTNGASHKHSGAVVDISAFGARLAVQNLDGVSERNTILTSFTLPSGTRVSNVAMIVQNISSESEKQYVGGKFVAPEQAVTDYYNECMRNLR
jgi:hypothetical protein